MNTKFPYTSIDNQKFLIYFCIYEQKNIRVFLSDLSSTNKVFMANYKLDDLNIKFIKIIQFKTIEQFMSI